MTDLPHLHLPHPRRARIPRQACVWTTCQNPTCSQAGADVLPSLGSCPSCGEPLTEIRTVPPMAIDLNDSPQQHVPTRREQSAPGRGERFLGRLPGLLEVLILAGAAPAVVLTCLAVDDAAPWQVDVLLWRSLGMLSVLTGVLGLPRLVVDLARVRVGWQRELVVMRAVVNWLPFAVLMLFYPYPPLEAGRLDSLARVESYLLVLVFTIVVVLAHAAINQHWRAEARRELVRVGDVLAGVTR